MVNENIVCVCVCLSIIINERKKKVNYGCYIYIYVEPSTYIVTINFNNLSSSFRHTEESFSIDTYFKKKIIKRKMKVFYKWNKKERKKKHSWTTTTTSNLYRSNKNFKRIKKTRHIFFF